MALVQRVSAALVRAGLTDRRLAVGLSGGLDSMVLLDVLAQLRRQHPFRLCAVHVNHRISPDAGRWAQLCAVRCGAYAVACTVAEVDVERTSRDGLEAAARAARYAVFIRQDVDAVVLAHHLDDQAETLLLQLLRGAGARGLSAMPESRLLSRDSPIVLLRPLLDVPRTELAAYARRRRLRWVEDASNASLDFDRNWLRHEVLPRIAARFPAYRETWLRAARNLADASELGDALARIDAATAAVGEGLRANALRTMGEARARNVLRWFLERSAVPLPGRARLDEALRQLLLPRVDAQPLVELGAVRLRRHRGVIHLVERESSIPRAWRAAWHGEAQLRLPDPLGTLHFQATSGSGLSRARLDAAPVSVRLRTGGERMKPWPERPVRTLKNLLREAGIPAWQRERLPIVFCGESSVWVPGIGCDSRFVASASEPAVLIRWVAGGQAYTS